MLPFRFLDLPQELRNEIYEYDLESCSRVRFVKKGRLVSNSGLQFVCRQIDNELATLLINTAHAGRGKLVFPVNDFDFKPALIKALQWLMSDTSVDSVTIRLSMTKSWSSFPTLDGLPRWCKFINEISKRDKAFEIMYTIGSVQDAPRAEMFLYSLVGNEPSGPPGRALLSMIWSFLTWYADIVEETGTELEVNDFKERVQNMKFMMESVGMVLEGPLAETPQQTYVYGLAEMIQDAQEACRIADEHFGDYDFDADLRT